MLIVKHINNNAAMAKDENGNDLVVFGTGVGFPQMPYELDDISCISRVFRNVNSELLDTIFSISEEVLGVALDIVKEAKRELGGELNPNLYLTLADHLQFATDRVAKGVVIENPLAGEIPFVYPSEYEIGKRGIEIMFEQTGVRLPPAEACAIALHLANAETDGGGFSNNMRAVIESVEVIEQVIELLEKRLEFTFDRSTHSYMRLVSHLRYLVRRLQSGEEYAEGQDSSLVKQLGHDFPVAYDCVRAVARLLRRKKGWRLSNEETIYLMMHITRFVYDAKR